MDLWPKRTTIWRPLASACLLITTMPGRPYPNAQVNPERRSRLVNTPTRHEDRILIDGSTSGKALMREKSTVHVSDMPVVRFLANGSFPTEEGGSGTLQT